MEFHYLTILTLAHKVTNSLLLISLENTVKSYMDYTTGTCMITHCNSQQIGDNYTASHHSISLCFYTAALAFELDRLGRSSESPITLNCPTTGLLPTVTYWEKNGGDLVSGGTYEITTQLRDRRTTSFDNYLRIYQTLQLVEGIYRCIPVSSMDGPIQDRNITRSSLLSATSIIIILINWYTLSHSY